MERQNQPVIEDEEQKQIDLGDHKVIVKIEDNVTIYEVDGQMFYQSDIEKLDMIKQTEFRKLTPMEISVLKAHIEQKIKEANERLSKANNTVILAGNQTTQASNLLHEAKIKAAEVETQTYDLEARTEALETRTEALRTEAQNIHNAKQNIHNAKIKAAEDETQAYDLEARAEALRTEAKNQIASDSQQIQQLLKEKQELELLNRTRNNSNNSSSGNVSDRSIEKNELPIFKQTQNKIDKQNAVEQGYNLSQESEEQMNPEFSEGMSQNAQSSTIGNTQRSLFQGEKKIDSSLRAHFDGSHQDGQ